jgi:hypothetical protein
MSTCRCSVAIFQSLFYWQHVAEIVLRFASSYAICDASQIWYRDFPVDFHTMGLSLRYRNFPADLRTTRRGSSTAIFRLTCTRRVVVLVPQFSG